MKFEEVMNFWNLTRELAKIGRIACELLPCNDADGMRDLRSKIRVWQMPLFKFLLSGDMKIKIFVSTRLKVLKYITRKFCPKTPPSCLIWMQWSNSQRKILYATRQCWRKRTPTKHKDLDYTLLGKRAIDFKRQTLDKIEGIRPLTLTKRASCIGRNRSLIQNSEFATQGRW